MAETKGSSSPLVSVVIPVWNSGRWLSGCLEALGRQSFVDFEVILVDNGSTDGSLALVGSINFLDLTVLSFTENRGFAAAANAGIIAARGEFVALLNVDTEAEPDWLIALLEEMEGCSGQVAALASCMVQMQDPSLIDDAGDSLSWYGAATKRGYGQPLAAFSQKELVDSVCAGAALYRRDFFVQVGLFDERFGSYLEDVDLCLRGRLLGYSYIYVPAARVRHQGHGSGVYGTKYVFLMTRNRLLLLLKNLPMRLLVRNAFRLLYGQLYFFLLYRRPLASLRGYFGALKLIGHIWKFRRSFVDRSRGMHQVSPLFLKMDPPGPALRTLIKRKLLCV